MIILQVYLTLLGKWYNKFKGVVKLEKRKLFKLSVIEHTMSKPVYDQNIFYTSDSDLMLKFELIEKEYSYERGDILLYNETDKSFVTRTLNKVDDGFAYQIDDDIIQHFGEWTGQLQLVKNGEVYTTKPFTFTIENDLSSVSPPQLIDINSWATLKQSAIDLIDDMQNVIYENETAALAYQQAENVRSVNETDRKQAESTRQNNETARQIQERDREINEVARKENEVTRVDNETERQTYEQERQSAEVIRVENENQRKIDHANRSVEFDGKADKIVLENLTPSALGNWTTVYATTSLSENEYSLTVTSNSDPLRLQSRNITPIVGHKYYINHETKPSVNTEISTHIGDSIINVQGNKDTYTKTTVVLEPVNTNPVRIYVRSLVASVGDIHRIRNIILFDLTDIFGTGNEPTKEEMDELIKITGYINGEYALNNKDMLIWTLALIRQNKNAILALGGTI